MGTEEPPSSPSSQKIASGSQKDRLHQDAIFGLTYKNKSDFKFFGKWEHINTR